MFLFIYTFTVCVCVQLLNLQVRRAVTQSAAGSTARLTPWKPALLGQSKRRFSADLFRTVHLFNPVTARCPWRKRPVRGRASTPPAPAVCCWTPRRARTHARAPTPPACTGTEGVCTLTWRGCLIRFATTIYRCVMIIMMLIMIIIINNVFCFCPVGNHWRTLCAWSHRVRARLNDKFTLRCQSVHYKNYISHFECGVNLNKAFTYNKNRSISVSF